MCVCVCVAGERKVGMNRMKEEENEVDYWLSSYKIESATRIHIPNETVCISLHANASIKSMNPFLLSFCYTQIISQAGYAHTCVRMRA